PGCSASTLTSGGCGSATKISVIVAGDLVEKTYQSKDTKSFSDKQRPQSEVNLAALAVDRIRRGSIYEIVDPFLEPNRDAWTLYSINKVAGLAFRCLVFIVT
ncbi:hypothetical protein TSUD_57910, partial [Trifolium subterraneum]